MNKIILSLMILVSVVTIYSNTMASYVFDVAVGDKITMTSYNSLTDAGAFDLLNLDNGYKWNSFCLEKDQTLSQTFFIGSITDYALPGGVAGRVGSFGDPISDFTAWLYMSAETGTLFNYDGGNKDSYDLQNLIWFNEKEIQSESKYYDPTSVTIWYSTFNASGWKNDGIVQVLNMYKDINFTKHAQDQLIMGIAVPEPTTFLLLGGGLLFFVYMGRQKLSSTKDKN